MHRTVRQSEGCKMSKRWIVVAFGILTLAVFAEPVKMPSKSEINAAKDAVEALMSSGTTAKEFLEIASESESGAERYHAYRCAFIMQAKEGKFEEAAETLKTFQSEVTGVPASEIVSLVDKNVGKKLNEAKDLQVVYNDSKAKVTAGKQMVKIKKEIAKNPKDSVLKRSLAEATAISGDWTAALTEFEKAGGDVSDIVKAEKNGPTAKIAAFWWDYKPHKSFGATNAFKLHAASLYEGLLAKGGLSRLEESLAEKRIAAAKKLGEMVKDTTGNEGEPKSEFAALKKICNTRGLVHCWRFNGNLKDCVSGSFAIPNGSVAVTPTQVNLIGNRGVVSYIDLGERVVPLNGSPFTIEIWASNNGIRNFSRVFTFGDDCLIGQITQSWTRYMDINTERFNKEGSELINNRLSPFELGTEYHLAFVIEPKDNQLMVKRYKQDAVTGGTLASNEHLFNINMIFTNPRMWLGHSAAFVKGNDDACASYNEVRIWNRALSEEELTQNAVRFYKAGETMNPNELKAAVTSAAPVAKESKSGSSSKKSSPSKSDAFGTVID